MNHIQNIQKDVQMQKQSISSVRSEDFWQERWSKNKFYTN